MSNMKRGLLSKILIWAFVILFVTIILAISWIGTCGVIYLITLCFDWVFKWGVATGIWLVLLFIVPLLKPSITVKR